MAEVTLDLTPPVGKGKKKPEPVTVKFDVKDRPTVREQLAYWSILGETRARGSMYERYWEAARSLIVKWESAIMPLDLDLDAADDPRQVEIIRKTGIAVFGHVSALEAVPKN